MRGFFLQVIKYGVVGVLNTLLTAIVIWIILSLFSDINTNTPPSTFVMFIANILGYLIGLINSFILNRNWTFKNNTDWRNGFIRFIAVFGLCYAVQLGVVLWLNSLKVMMEWQINFNGQKYIITSSYTYQLIGIIVYSILNFLLNKYYTFRDCKQNMDINVTNIEK